MMFCLEMSFLVEVAWLYSFFNFSICKAKSLHKHILTVLYQAKLGRPGSWLSCRVPSHDFSHVFPVKFYHRVPRRPYNF